MRAEDKKGSRQGWASPFTFVRQNNLATRAVICLLLLSRVSPSTLGKRSASPPPRVPSSSGIMSPFIHGEPLEQGAALLWNRTTDGIWTTGVSILSDNASLIMSYGNWYEAPYPFFTATAPLLTGIPTSPSPSVPGNVFASRGIAVASGFAGQDFFSYDGVFAKIDGSGQSWEQRVASVEGTWWQVGNPIRVSANGTIVAYAQTWMDHYDPLAAKHAQVAVVDTSSFAPRVIMTDSFPNGTGLEDILFSDDGSTLVVIAANDPAGSINSSEVRVYSVAAGGAVQIYSVTTGYVFASCLSSNGKWLVLATCDSENAIEVYAIGSGGAVQTANSSYPQFPGSFTFAATCAVSDRGSAWVVWPLWWGGSINQTAVGFYASLPSTPTQPGAFLTPTSLWLSPPISDALQDDICEGVYIEASENASGVFAFTSWGGAPLAAGGAIPPTLRIFTDASPAAPLVSISTPSFDGTSSGSLEGLDVMRHSSGDVIVVAAGMNDHANIGSSAGTLYAYRVAVGGVGEAWPTNCFNASGQQCACGPGCELCGPPWVTSSPAAPQFHVGSASCAENDPNFSFFDATHGLYHHFWQERIAMPRDGQGSGPVIGHAVSANLAQWAHLPVALWNDSPWDSRAVYTGSTTIVNGAPVMMYPGLCTNEDFPGCTGMVFAVAVPADHDGDPLLTRWTKPAYNPVLNASGDDPTTAWLSPGGEYRMTRKDGKVFYSRDFIQWSQASCTDASQCGPGGQFFNTSECGDFHPLPRFCAQPTCDQPGPAPLPNFVRKQSFNGDTYTLGTYDFGPANTTGTWYPSPDIPLLQPYDASVRVDGRPFQLYIAEGKSFYDASKDRRIEFFWLKFPNGGAGTQSLAREVRYHAGLGRLMFAPVDELSLLRKLPALFTAESVPVPASDTGVSLGGGLWPAGAGNQSEIFVSLSLPSTSAVFGVSVLAGSGRASGFQITLAFDPQTFTANASVGSSSAPLPLIRGVDAAITIHVFIDRSVIEVFIGDGRLAFSTPANTPFSSTTADVVLFSNSAFIATNASVYAMESCWVTPQEVLASRTGRAPGARGAV